jgi:hypothetical protein
MSNTSIGRGPAAGGNENHDGDALSKTLGEKVKQEPPAGNDLVSEAAADPDTPDRADADTAKGKRPPR